jgi:crotonobetainyl-CoA:carnitine CoA-transferase CaiB-like acyl-CoA transferase
MARILDLTSEVGAYGARLLVELGHEVIRVESAAGDTLRRQMPLGEPALETGAFHNYLNAGKRSFTPNLLTDAGRQLLQNLAATADVAVVSLPGRADEEALRAANPNLVIVRLDDGPPEICAYARSGLMAITGDPDRAPLLMGGHIPHAAIGTFLAIATASALLVKQMTGQGQTVDVSAQQCLDALTEQVMIEYVTAGEIMQRRGSRGGITAVAGALPCADGEWMICVPPTEDGWKNFAAMVDDPMFRDPALAMEAGRREKRDEILDRVAEWSAPSSRSELVANAQERHIPASPVTTPLDLIDDPQLTARGFLKAVDHPRFGAINMPQGAMASLWGCTLAPAPALGQHNAEILASLGHAPAECRRLIEEACR